MEIKTDAIVLRAADYKDADKILTLLTPSAGKLTAGIKGVKFHNEYQNFFVDDEKAFPLYE